MKKSLYALILLVVLGACSDSKETRLQRYLLQGNEMVKLHELKTKGKIELIDVKE